jgi:hypothetical protein
LGEAEEHCHQCSIVGPEGNEREYALFNTLLNVNLSSEGMLDCKVLQAHWRRQAT